MGLKYSVNKQLPIDKPAAEIFKVVADFESWSHWSPWLCQEPDCPVTRSGERTKIGHKQEWNGKRIGSGYIEIIAIDQDKSITYNMVMHSPWKSQSEVQFHFENKEDNCIVSWNMRAQLPWFLFFMKKMMIALIGQDFLRGLMMLKDYCETGEVHSLSELKGEQEMESFYYLGFHHTTSISDMPQTMTKDYEELHRMIKKGELEQPQGVISLSHKYDFAKGECEFTSAFRYEREPKAIKGLKVGRVPRHKVMKIQHQGVYKHLGNAWTLAINEQRNRKRKMNKKVPMWEEYLNMPGEVSDKDLLAQIHIPIR